MINDTLLRKISLYNEFSTKELTLLENELILHKLKKGTIILSKNEICSSINFILKGAIYHYFLDEDLNKNIIDLNTTNNWVINHKSFTSQKPSEYYIETYEESIVYQISIESLHKLIAQSQSFLKLGKILNESISRIDFFDKNNTPDEKYIYLLDNYPQLIQSFPQKIIASFLKITPETLSRVRRRLS